MHDDDDEITVRSDEEEEGDEHGRRLCDSMKIKSQSWSEVLAPLCTIEMRSCNPDWTSIRSTR